MEDNQKEQIDAISKYYCTVNRVVHFGIALVYTVLFITVAVLIPQEMLWWEYSIGTGLGILILYIAYKVSYRIRESKGKLNIHKVKAWRKIVFVLSTVVFMCVLSMIGGFLQVIVMLKQLT